MKILMLHNKYKVGGGEDIQTEEEFTLLRKHGIDIELFCVTNDSIDANNNALKLAVNTIWSSKYYKPVTTQNSDREIQHYSHTKFFPLISPSIFYAAKKAGAKVVMTIHNYRLICPNALMYVNHKICNDCVGKTIPFPALFKKCYRDDLAATAVTVAMMSIHNVLHTWQNKIDGLICISDFVKNQLLLGGFSKEQLHLKFNFVSSDVRPVFEEGEYYIFVGRISVEKGIEQLLETFAKNQKKLFIIGDGPLSSKAAEFSARNSNIEFLGKFPLNELYKKISKARALISPSQSNEPFGRTVIEAFAHGTPVIGSSLGGINELIHEGENGFLFDPYKESDLTRAIKKFEQTEDVEGLRRNAFRSYEDNYTPELNYKRIMEIYNTILSS